MQAVSPLTQSRLVATYDDKNLKTLVSLGESSRLIHKLVENPHRHMTIVSHYGCPDGSWSANVASRLLSQRHILHLLQSYPLKAAEVEVNLLKQHGAMKDNGIVMTADILLDMDIVLAALDTNKTVVFILTDHHGGSGKTFLKDYLSLNQHARQVIDHAIDSGRLIVNIDTTESGTSHLFNLLCRETSPEQLKELFDLSSDLELASLRQFMKSYDLTTMQSGAVLELTRFANEHCPLDDASQAIVDKCRAGIGNGFIKENILHYLLCYLGDSVFNARFHYAHPDSNESQVIAPSYFDSKDPSYPGGKDDPHHKVLMKVPANTQKFVTDLFDQFKDFNQALKRVNSDEFIAVVNRAGKVMDEGQPVTYVGEKFLAVNTQSRHGRFIQALVSDTLQRHPDCHYAVLFENQFNVSLVRGMGATIDLTEVASDWLAKGLIQSGGGHPEAVGMQPDRRQYASLLLKCQSAEVPLSEKQQMLLRDTSN